MAHLASTLHTTASSSLQTPSAPDPPPRRQLRLGSASALSHQTGSTAGLSADSRASVAGSSVTAPPSWHVADCMDDDASTLPPQRPEEAQGHDLLEAQTQTEDDDDDEEEGGRRGDAPSSSTTTLAAGKPFAGWREKRCACVRPTATPAPLATLREHSSTSSFWSGDVGPPSSESMDLEEGGEMKEEEPPSSFLGPDQVSAGNLRRG